MFWKFILAIIPLIGTSVGAFIGTVNGLNKRLSKKEGTLVAFATGILCAICYNLFTEACAYVTNLTMYAGGIVGVGFILYVNLLAHKAEMTLKDKVFWAMLFHNIPEGIVIGISLANNTILPSTYSLILSIALQNLPDGLVVSMPLVANKGKRKAMLYGILSGVVEPLATMLIVVTAGRLSNIQMFEPFLVGFSVASVFLIAKELLKECGNSRMLVLGTAILTIFTNNIIDIILA